MRILLLLLLIFQAACAPSGFPAVETPSTVPGMGRIAFASERDGRSAIYVAGADGSNVTRLSPPELEAIHPAWSPDGSRIAFNAREDGLNDIYVMNADG